MFEIYGKQTNFTNLIIQFLCKSHTNQLAHTNTHHQLPGDLSLHHDQRLRVHTVFLSIVSTSNGMQHLSDQGNHHRFFLVDRNYPDLNLNMCYATCNQTTCTMLPSKFLAGTSLCTWSNSAGCSVTQPPSSLTFSLMVTLVCYMICIPLDLFIGHFQEAYGSKMPAFDR